MLEFAPEVESYRDGEYYDTFGKDDDVTIYLLNKTVVDGTICDITNDTIIIDINLDSADKDYRSFKFEEIDYLDWL